MAAEAVVEGGVMMLELSNKLTFNGPKLITSEFIIEFKEQIVHVQVPRRGITIMRKQKVEVPYNGVIVINGNYCVHPVFEGILREKLGKMFAENIDRIYQELLHRILNLTVEGTNANYGQ